MLVAVRELGGLAEVHHHHPVGDVPHDVEVVRDEDVGQAELPLEVLEEIEDLRLHGDVERRDRLVAEDELRVHRERARDADPLPLAARELVREAIEVLGVEADDLEELLDAPLALGGRPDAVELERLADDEPDPLARVERRVRVLEDHHHVPPQRPHLASRQPGDVAALVDDAAGGRLEQLEEAADERRLPAARLADDPERLALAQRERDAVDRLHGRDLLLEDDPAGDREVLLQVLDDEELVAGAHALAPAVRVATSAAASRAFVSSSRWQACSCVGSCAAMASTGSFSRQTGIA